jgi:hypothetical protein
MLYASINANVYDYPLFKVLDKVLDVDIIICCIWDFTISFINFENNKF